MAAGSRKTASRAFPKGPKAAAKMGVTGVWNPYGTGMENVWLPVWLLAQIRPMVACFPPQAFADPCLCKDELRSQRSGPVGG